MQTLAKSPVPGPDTELKFNGMAYGQGLAEGKSATIPLKPMPVTIKCIKIETDSVLVSVDGEVTPRRLTRN